MTPAQNMAAAFTDDEHQDNEFTEPSYKFAPEVFQHYQYDRPKHAAVGALTGAPFGFPVSGVDLSHIFKGIRPSKQEVEASSFTASQTVHENVESHSAHSVALADSAQTATLPKVDRQRLADAPTVDNILGVLRDYGHIALAEEINELISRLADEPDEPSPNADSLKLLARVAFGESSLRAPRSLALTKEGYLHAEWHLGQAKLFMTFLPTAHIRVVAVHPGTGGDDALHVAGSLYSPNTESLAKWLAASLLK